MTTDKVTIQILAEVCRSFGMKHLVFSPGSRSAPLVVAFSQMKEFNCSVIPDERVAGFFAMGIAQQSKIPVGVICTSGTAVLNLAPAICEAYYQKIPLLIMTADRPAEWIGQGENQAIEQTEIYKNYIKGSFALPVAVENETAMQNAANICADALNLSKQGDAGPVHVNIPLREPLYNFAEASLPLLSIKKNPSVSSFLSKEDKLYINSQWSSASKKMIVCGMDEGSEERNKLLQQLAERKDVILLSESISNISVSQNIYNIDAVIDTIKQEEVEAFIPDIVVTIGGQIISKKIRMLLRQYKPKKHWHISKTGEKWNTFLVLDKAFACEQKELLQTLIATPASDSNFSRDWWKKQQLVVNKLAVYNASAPFSDFKVFSKLSASFPENAQLQWGNSSPIRYSTIFQQKRSLQHFSNRGTSGIDGCVSTAAGAAWVNGKLTICIVGDVSFFYDSNALWNPQLSPNLRIIMVNNSGGNIFRLIPGPQKVAGFEKFFETKHHLSAEYLAQMYEIPYYFCEREEDLDFVLHEFYKPQKGKPAILEIKTKNELSAETFKKYQQYLAS